MNDQLFTILAHSGNSDTTHKWLPANPFALGNTTWLLYAGTLLLFAATMLTAYYTGVLGAGIGMLLLSLIVGVPALLACLVNPLLGLSVLVSVSFVVMGIKKYLPGEPPLGILLDVFTLFLFMGIFARQAYERNFTVLKHPVTLLVLAWIAFNLVEVLNPWAHSQLAWLYTVRGMAGLTLLYFVALYAFSNLRSIAFLLKLLLFWGVAAAIYGIYQEFAGFNSVEWAWLNADEQRYELIFQWGLFRKFSFLSDPTTFGILMAYLGVVSLSLAVFGSINILKKMLLWVCALLMFAAMVYSGTRAAFVLVPAGIALTTLLTFRPKIVLLSGILLMVGMVVVFKSTSNPTLYRVRSAFTPAKDESLQLRLSNQKRIQPYIQTHPIGGGLGSTGEWGRRFSPNSELAKFPPDSGLARIAVEQGWIGLLLFTIFSFSVLVLGVRTYLRSRQPQIKMYALAFLTITFLLTIANYPQEAIFLLPNSIIYYVSVAALVRLRQLDTVAVPG